MLTKNLKLSMPIGKKSLLKYISDESADKNFNIDDPYFELDVTKDFIKKVNLYSGFDTNDFITINSKISKDKSKKIIVFSGDNYDLKYDGDSKVNKEIDIKINKLFFKYLDDEDYKLYCKVTITPDNIKVKSLVFISSNNNFRILMASMKQPKKKDE